MKTEYWMWWQSYCLFISLTARSSTLWVVRAAEFETFASRSVVLFLSLFLLRSMYGRTIVLLLYSISVTEMYTEFPPRDMTYILHCYETVVFVIHMFIWNGLELDHYSTLGRSWMRMLPSNAWETENDSVVLYRDQIDLTLQGTHHTEKSVVSLHFKRQWACPIYYMLTW